jgi:metallophosphoesterase (TIGR03767 family)
VEDLDQVYEAFSAAWRPWEALMPHTVDASIRQINAQHRSPVAQGNGKRADLGFAVLTGDNADNQQRNETKWVARLLDGGRLDPNSGSSDTSTYGACPASLAAEAPKYTGVQDYDDYADSGTYYDPDQPAGQWSKWPTYPGLMDHAQQPFDVAGLDVPSYVALGNHDGLVQGNQAANAGFNAVATGCVKQMAPAVAPADLAGSLTSTLLTTSPQNTVLVPPDPDRAEIAKPEYRALFAGGRQSDAYGFAFVDPKELEASAGAASYYDFSPAPGLRIVTLDTVATGGVVGIASEGNVDDPQFQWLTRTLDAAEKADELVIVTSHHGPTSLSADVPDEIAGPCEDPAHPANPGCDLDPRDSSPIHLGDDVNALLLAHPHVIAWVAGHSHVNDVAAVKRADGQGGFWVIRTSAEADFPHQDRVIDVMDNRDGTLSLFGTLLDNASPATAPPSGTAAAGLDKDAMASIARTLGYNDPQKSTGATGNTDDRNVELLIGDPRTAKRTAGAARAGTRVRVTPRRIVAGRRTRVHIRVTRNGRPVKRTRVHFAGRKLRTNHRGRVAVRIRPRRTGLLRVRAGRAAAPVLVVRR